MQAFGEGIWGEVADRRVEIIVAVVSVSIIAIQSGFSLRKLVAGKWGAGAVVVGAFCALVIWHSFRSAYFVSKDIKNERSYDGFSGGSSTDIPRYSWPRLELYSIAVCLSMLSFTTAYLTSTKAKEIQQSDLAYLHEMTNRQLVEATKKLTDEMISFENDRDKESIKAILDFSRKLAKATNQEERDKLNQEIQQESVTAWKDKESDFRKNYLDHASAVRDELLFRLRKTPEQSEKDALATLPPMEQMLHGGLPLSRALGGTLVGPHPIADAAIYLDGLARLLQ